MALFDDLIPEQGGVARKGSRPSTTGAGLFDDLMPAPASTASTAPSTAVRPAMAKGDESSWLGSAGNVLAGAGERTFDVMGGLGDTMLAGLEAAGVEATNPFVANLRRGTERAKDMDFGYEEATSWEDFKSAPLANFVPFALEQGLVSTPDMAAALMALPAYIAARAGELGDKRAENNGIENASVTDLLATLPAAAASALLERFGARGMLGLDDVAIRTLKEVPGEVGKAAIKEAGTEAAQEGIEYTGTNLGTVKGFDPAEAGEQMLAGAVGGAGFGGAIRTGTATAQALRPAGTSDTLPEGAGSAEDFLGEETVVPVPADRIRLNSPRLTQDDRASPIPNDLIDDGKGIFDGSRNMRSEPGLPEPDMTDLDLSELEAAFQQDFQEDQRAAEASEPSFMRDLTPDDRAAYLATPGINRAVARSLGTKIDELDAKGDGARADKLRGKLDDILGSFGLSRAPRSSNFDQGPTPAAPEPDFGPGFDAEIQAAAGAAPTMPQGGGLAPPSMRSGDGSRTAPVAIRGAADLDGVADRVATAPTDGQKAAGNYQKAHGRWNGLTVSIENPRGSQRTGTDANGKGWSVTMPAHYGDFKGTKGNDGDPVDVYVGENPASQRVFVLDQKDADTGAFDEVKVVIGANSEAEVAAIYNGAFSDGRAGDRLQGITETSISDLKDWLKNGNAKVPFAEYSASPKAKRERLAALPKKPVTRMLRDAGGVDPSSALAGNLRDMDITPRTAPGLFKNGGMGAADNFVAAEHPLFEGVQDDGNGYIPEEAILEALRREMGGDPLRTAEEFERAMAAQPQQLEDAELDAAPDERQAPARDRRVDIDPDVEVDRLIEVYGYPDSPELRQTAVSFIERGLDPEDAIVAASESLAEQIVQPTEGASTDAESGIPFFAGDPGWEAASDGEGIRADQPGAEKRSGQGVAGAEGGPRAGVEADGSERETAGRSGNAGQVAAPSAPAVEPGADGKPQIVIPGAERASDRDMAQRGADARMRPNADQRPMDDGLFGSSSQQTDLLETAKASAPKAAEAPSATQSENQADPSTAPTAAAPKKPKLRKMGDRLRNYFRPGRIVESYGGGRDEVVSFDAGERGTWTVTVRDVDSGQTRGHSTPPSMRELAAWERANPVPEPAKPADAATKAEPAAQRAIKEKIQVQREAAKIEDFGEKIEGARKDQIRELSDSLSGDVDIAAEPLSKVFPQPDYVKLAEAGVDPQAMGLIAVARDAIPAKPRRTHKVRRWADQVRVLRDFARDLIDGQFDAEAVRLLMRGNPALSGLADTASVIAELEPALLQKASKWRVDSASYTMLKGERFEKPKRFYTLKDDNGRYVTDGGDILRSETLEGLTGPARDAIRRVLGEAKVSTKERRTKISVYSDRQTKDLFIGFKGRSGVIRLKSGFASIKDARSYISEHADELQATIDAMRSGPSMRREENRPREGVDRREGDVTPEQFRETFGFRGVQFGNYVEGPRRQFELNEAFDGLMDLADTLSIPPQAISLNGTLGLAFGARGRGGNAKAHYEPGQVVINLTKSKGAGSLAHEWFHGFDHAFAMQDSGQREGFMSERRRDSGETRQEVYEAWKAVEKALIGGEYASRMGQLDAARSKPYWNTMIEKAARAFEKYVVDRLAAQGATNDYLANIDENAGAYPNPKEMREAGITQALDNLFKVIETRQTESGTELFSWQGDLREAAAGWGEVEASPATRLTEAEQQDVLDIVRRVSGLSDVEFHEAIQIPSTAKGFRAWGREGKEGEFIPIAGFYHRMKDMIAIALNSGGDGKRLAFHESFHRVQAMFLTDQEKALLAAESEALRSIIAATLGREAQAANMAQIELEAEAFAIYAERMDAGGKAPLRLKGRIRAAWDRVRTMTRRVRNYLNGRGYQTFEDVFDTARSGEMKARDTRGAKFRRWFGQSKIVDANGKPRVVYHGSRANIETFNVSDGNGRAGAYFTSDAKYSSDYALGKPGGTAGARTYPVYLKVENPFVIKGPGFVEKAKAMLSGRRVDNRATQSSYVTDERAADLRAQGYDGIVNEGANEIVIFDANQVKSAAGNSGAFDPNDDRIQFDIAPEFTGPDTAPQRRTQGFLAKGQPIDRAIRAPFDWIGGLNENNEWKPGRYLTDRVANVITSAKFDPNGRFSWMNNTLETARAGLIDRHGLDAEYVDRDRRRALDERRVMLRGAEVLKSLADQNVGMEEAKVLQAILTGEAVDDAAMSKLAEPIRMAIDELGQEAVALGLLSAESFERNRGSYLHRVYMKNELEQNGLTRMVSQIMGKSRKKIIGNQFKGRGMFFTVEAEALTRSDREFAAGRRGAPQNGDKFRLLEEIQQDMLEGTSKVVRRVYLPASQKVPADYAAFRDQGIWEVRGKKGGKPVMWRDYTKAEREKMGEILDARYTIGKTYMMMSHDLATGRFYQDIATNEEWTRTGEPEGTKWKNAADVKRMAIDPELQWVRVPDTDIPNTGGKKRWGALAGKFVRAEIWRDLNEIEVMNSPTAWRMLLTQWKLNKTVRSPVVHMNNVMSNMMFMDLADIRMQDLMAGVRSYAAGDADYQEAAANSAFGSDMMSQEVRDNVLKPVLAEIAKSVQESGDDSFTGRAKMLGKIAETIGTKLSAMDQKMKDAYRIEDEVFRMATYLRRRQLGDDAKAAADFAREQFLDYDIRAPWVNAARNTVLPFLSYTYRAVPLVAKAIATRPWKLAKYYAIGYAVNALAYAMADDDDEERERASLREQERGNTWLGLPRMLRMPFNSADDLPVFLDVRRWIPAGDVFDTNQGAVALPIPAPLQFGGPLMIGAELFLNRQAFTGEDITNKLTDTGPEKVGKVGEYLWKSYMPSAAWVPGSWYWEKISNAASGATDGTGRPYDLPSAIASSVGIKLKPQDVDNGLHWRFFDLQKVKRELDGQLRTLGRQRERGLISQKAFDKGVASIVGKFGRLEAEGLELGEASRRKQ